MLCDASRGSDKSAKLALTLLRTIYLHCHGIVFDKPNNRIMKEYKANTEGYPREWMFEMCRRKGKSTKVDTSSHHVSRRSIRDRDDRKFVEACSLTSDKILITSDRRYDDPPSRDLLKRLGISLLGVAEALDEL